jgi:hypothetical protein
MTINYRGERFAGYNKAKRTPGHPKKSHAVLAKEGDKVKLIRFGQQGVSGSPKRKMNLLLIERGANHLRRVIVRTSIKERCLRLIGRTQ